MVPYTSFLIVSIRTVVALSCLLILFFVGGCGGGGSDNGPSPTETVTVQGTVDDGGENSPVREAACRFVDLSGGMLDRNQADQNGIYTLRVPPDVEGYIQCNPQGLGDLILSTYANTQGMEPGQTLSNEDVSPATTVMADIIQTEQPADPQTRKYELMNAIYSRGDPQLNLMVDLSRRLYKGMRDRRINVTYGHYRS